MTDFVVLVVICYFVVAFSDIYDFHDVLRSVLSHEQRDADVLKMSELPKMFQKQS